MRHREFRYRRPRRSRGLLWVLLGLAGIGTAAVVLGERRRRSSAQNRPEETLDSAQGFYPPEPPESISVWVPGPAGNLYVRDGGKSEHIPIVFVHSLAGNGGQWALQLDHLRRRRRAVAFDLRGHGEADPAEDADYSIAGLAADLEAVADQLGLRRFILAGHSLGSVVAIEYASRHPERVAGLLLVDPNGDLTRMPQDQKEAFVSPLRQDPIGELTSYYRQLVVGGDADAARWVLEDLRLTHEDAVVPALESSMEYPVIEALGKYPGPKLAVVSDMNNLPYSLHRMLPELTARLMTGTGHWLMMDRPELFNRIVDEFLEEVEGA
ncbi:MAG TPA: alpha/beta hydrolase [Thermoanaerobaculia bacterium]|nr:alpha/beta hydrolase [Thermoanaerobaculia bacterium]